MYMYTSGTRDSRARRKIINLRKARKREKDIEREREKESERNHKRTLQAITNELLRKHLSFSRSFPRVFTAKKRFVFDAVLKKSRPSLREEPRYIFLLFFFLVDRF